MFQNVDWSMKMKHRYENTSAPFIPFEATFNERQMRDSISAQNKPKGGKGAAGLMMGLLKNDDTSKPGVQLTFD